MTMTDRFPFPMMTAWSRQVALVAVLIAGLLLCATAASGWKTWSRLHAPHSAPDSTQSRGQSTVAPVKQVADWHLFGHPLSGDTAALPQTHLQLELTGVMMGATPASPAMAIISAPGQPGRVVRVGDRLPSTGVRVNAITREAVVLENGGHLERLILQRSPLQFGNLPESILGG